MGRVVVYIAQSVDGLIAPVDGSLGWLEPFGDALVGFDDFLRGVGAIVMGRATAEAIAGEAWAYGDRPAWVVTSRALPTGLERCRVARDPQTAVEEARAATSGDVWVVGGGRTIAGCADRIDVWMIFTLPVLLGAGARLFLGGGVGTGLSLVGTGEYESGATLAVYLPRAGK